MRDHFDHERWDVYRLALEFVVLASEVRQNLPKGSGDLSDQLGRASTSIALNTAEGAGELRPLDKARFYRIACRSAYESAAILDALGAIGAVEAAQRFRGRGLLLRIVPMLVALAKRKQEDGRLRRTPISGSGSGSGSGRT